MNNILSQLNSIEQEHNISILYACESGSRAWGFPSPDSDYDVRFIYSRPIEYYLAIEEHRDVVEVPVNEVLDINGWDLRKALRLFYKSNAPLFEWFQSPIVYRQIPGFVEDIWQHAPAFFSLRAGLHHYSSMAYNAFSDLQKEMVRLKKYFYALRPLLAARWIIERSEIPPMEFHRLLHLLNDRSDLLFYIQELLQQKQVSDEKTLIPVIPELSTYIQQELLLCKQAAGNIPSLHPERDILNILFRKYLAIS